MDKLSVRRFGAILQRGLTSSTRKVPASPGNITTLLLASLGVLAAGGYYFVGRPLENKDRQANDASSRDFSSTVVFRPDANGKFEIPCGVLVRPDGLVAIAGKECEKSNKIEIKICNSIMDVMIESTDEASSVGILRLDLSGKGEFKPAKSHTSLKRETRNFWFCETVWFDASPKRQVAEICIDFTVTR